MIEDDEFPNVNPDNPKEQLYYYRRLKAKYRKQTANLSDDRLKTIVREGLKLCVNSEIRDPQDVLRFLALTLILTPEQKESEFLKNIIRLLLGHTDFSAKRRLNMIYKHVAGRLPPSPEPDFGPWYIQI